MDLTSVSNTLTQSFDNIINAASTAATTQIQANGAPATSLSVNTNGTGSGNLVFGALIVYVLYRHFAK